MVRVKGARGKGIPVPLASINEAIGLIRKVYENVGDRAMSFEELMNYIGKSTAFGKVFVKTFTDYGLMEKIEGGFWKISALGIRCINGDYSAIKESFEKVPIFRTLMGIFGKGKFTQKAVIDYLTNKYHKTEPYVKNAAEKFWSGKEYLESVVKGGALPELEVSIDTTGLGKTLKILQLKYAFNPPSEGEIEKLVDEVYEEFKEDENPAVRTLVESMKENRKKKDYLMLLFENLTKILSERYRILMVYEGKAKDLNQ